MSVIASNIPSHVPPAKVSEFFSFCGKVSDLVPLEDNGKTKKYQVVFANNKAVSTALLLNDAELDNAFIKVEEDLELTDGAKGLAPQQGGAGAGAGAGAAEAQQQKGDIRDTLSGAVGAGGTATGGGGVENDSIKTGDKTYDDVEQEEKPKYAILAQLLADGYVLSDPIIERGLEFDKKNGVSQRFQSFISSLDKKYVHSQDPESTVNQQLQKAQSTFASSGLQKYFDNAISSPLGQRIHKYYQSLAGDVKDVHEEAVRLAKIKKEEKEKEKQTVAGSGASGDIPGSSATEKST
ncbi:hypothetical protein CANMA_003263 [Candida margitis]|uniref:uncharacterized protein n=1 Tax=Candida margitis TaxID=1775924 RepID=UPI002225FC8F|nr:uncharacterized protein CANMA_003263 [Candida margitis]KAI5967206.1 hypothetical protein CANMA_003263 [Candida margitis]